MSLYPLEDSLRATRAAVTGIREKQFKKSHDVFDGAPCEWSAERGATHTLYCGETEGPFGSIGRGTRPAKLSKTVLYVGVDERDDQVVWEKWSIRQLWRFEFNHPLPAGIH